MSPLVRSEISLIRMRAGFQSLEAAAEALGCSRVWLSEVEVGKGEPSESLAERMAEKYAVTLEQIDEAIDAARGERLKRQLRELKERA